jgi:XTP/dITP diphosphohydrolase
MGSFLELLLATRNKSKIRELRRLLADSGIGVRGLEEWPELQTPEESGETFLENAVAKALYYHQATGLPAVGEDSGLEVDALGGAPGVHSARWMGEETPYVTKNARLLEKLAGVPAEKRTARYVCAVALAEEGKVVFHAVETCEGRIAAEPRGESGFGYDPIFYYPAFGKTLAEATMEEKNRVSHRGKAMARLREYLGE